MKIQLTLLFAVPVLSAAPVIRSGGVVNAASFKHPGVPGGALAQGSLATAFGSDLGPAQGVSANTYPLATTLAGVGVRITRQANTFDAFPVFVVAGQVNFLIPSTVPVGPAEVRISYNGVASAPEAIQIVRTSLGLFTFSAGGDGQRAVAQNFISGAETPVNLNEAAAKPGQTLIAYGTGLGPITAPDNLAAPAGDIAGVNVEVLVGGVTARRSYAGRSPCCSGLDQIVFEVPENAPLGCAVPVVIRAGDTYTNIGNVSIARNGGKCVEQSAVGDGTQLCANGAGGYIRLLEFYTQRGSQFAVPGLSPDSVISSADGAFARVSGCAPIVPLNLGSCEVTTTPITGGSGNSNALPQPTPVLPLSTLTTSYLDAGPTLNLRTPAGDVPFTRAGVGYFGSMPPFSISNPKLVMTAGTYTLSGAGGRDIGSLNTTFQFAPLRVTSHAVDGTLDPTRPPTIRWSGGEYARDFFLVSVYLADARFTSTVRCSSVGGRSGTFTIPAWVWSQLPSYTSGFAGVGIAGASFFDPIPTSAPGLDLGIGFNIWTAHTIPLTIR